MNPLRRLQDFGQSLWYDNIQRSMLKSGELARMVDEDGLRGVTSNPSIFEKAINGSTDYDASLAILLRNNPHLGSRDLFFSLAIEDIQAGADVLRPVFEASNGRDGMISLEVSPDLAYDTQGTIEEARKLVQRVNRPNLMIKVPATLEGVAAFERLISDGINVNVTLLFSVKRYKEVVEAYLRGLSFRQQNKLPVKGINSVASFFVSRVDTAVDALLVKHLATTAPELSEKILALKGKTAIANAKIAYEWYQSAFSAPEFQKLRQAGAESQRLLWASTGTKDPSYSDVLYIDTLIGKETVNTVPPTAYKAYKDHGKPAATLEQEMGHAMETIRALTAFGIDLDGVTQQLEKEGVEAFAKSFNQLLSAIDDKARHLREKLQAAG